MRDKVNNRSVDALGSRGVGFGHDKWGAEYGSLSLCIFRMSVGEERTPKDLKSQPSLSVSASLPRCLVPVVEVG